ncbi:hypothetical protein BKA57DRAFT_478820 [Linnemannia elongata]|nr:hypothetical protein BKA57DRAFT_478820 [Linnemannia elongata]
MFLCPYLPLFLCSSSFFLSSSLSFPPLCLRLLSLLFLSPYSFISLRHSFPVTPSLNLSSQHEELHEQWYRENQGEDTLDRHGDAMLEPIRYCQGKYKVIGHTILLGTPLFYLNPFSYCQPRDK